MGQYFNDDQILGAVLFFAGLALLSWCAKVERVEKAKMRDPKLKWAYIDADGKKRLVCLENSNLERIARLVAENPNHLDPLKWSVTGTITEFRGANFVFVRRAVLQSREHYD